MVTGGLSVAGPGMTTVPGADVAGWAGGVVVVVVTVVGVTVTVTRGGPPL